MSIICVGPTEIPDDNIAEITTGIVILLCVALFSAIIIAVLWYRYYRNKKKQQNSKDNPSESGNKMAESTPSNETVM